MNVYLKPDIEVLEEAVVTGVKTEAKEVDGGQRYGSCRSALLQSANVCTGSGQPNTEEYESFKENRFLSVVQNPLSTFSLDVDAASYGSIRRMINQGQMPERCGARGRDD